MKDKERKLHGRVVIELHNHRTGSRERIEHDNTFTDALEYYHLASGQYNNSPYANNNWVAQQPYIKYLGGIFLFDKEIEPVNGVYPITMPAGTKMIANGSYGVINGSAVTEMGSYNAQESSFTDSGYTYVYDWSTSQGNGEIACVSLTSDLGGFIGYGNSVSNVAHATKRSIFENQNVNALGFSNRTHITKGNVAYDCASNITTSLSIYKQTLGFTDISVFDGWRTLYRTVEVPSQISGTNRITVVADEGKIAVFPNRITANSSVTFGIYDIEADSWQSYTFVSDKDMNFASSGSYYPKFFNNGFYTYGRMYVFGESNLRTFNIHDAAQVIPLSNNIVLLHYSNAMLVYDITTGTLYPNNASYQSLFHNTSILDGQNRIHLTDSYEYNDAATRYERIYRSPLYLATINNLDEPVIKTSESTMKVIYTVTKANE